MYGIETRSGFAFALQGWIMKREFSVVNVMTLATGSLNAKRKR